ncbi:hypothetical protein [Catenulispora sp. GAS73]|uniref:hypothetical protein n=1 Tax=Catenulispora sp. GAS73 TaxID=3156269 RepID=UPI003516A9EA
MQHHPSSPGFSAGSGWAHSVEVWDGGEPIGGVFGIGMGTIFSAEATFHRRPGGGKVAIADLGRRLARTRPEAPIDVQVPSGYCGFFTAVRGARVLG